MKSEIEDDLNRYFERKYSRTLEGDVPVLELYQVVLKSSAVDFDSPEIQRLLAIIMQTLMSSHVAKFTDLTKLYNPLLFLCEYCREDELIEKLKHLWAKGTIGISIPDLQRKISRGGAVPRINGKLINYDRLNYSFRSVEQQLFTIFFSVTIKNNIQIRFNIADSLKQVEGMEGEQA